MIETNRIEFKRELTRDLDLEKEVVAFLNYREGGIIYIGVDNSGIPVGVKDIDGDILKIKARIRNGISPSPMGLFDVTIENINDIDVIKIFVASGSETPYYKTSYGMSEKGCYIRVGTAAEPMPQHMIEDLYAHRVRNSLRNIPSPRQNLTFRLLKVYYETKGLHLNSKFAENLDLLTNDGKYNYVAFLLADKNNISIKLAQYNSNNRTNLSSVNEYGYTCILQTADRIIEKLKIENKTFSTKTYKQRINTQLWDEKAIREIVLNALVHNDYTDETPPKFELFSDHLEILSSGSLPSGLTQEEFFSGVSKPRNKELMRVFCDVDLGESLGSGMASIMQVYKPENFEFMPHFTRFSVAYNHGGALNGALKDLTDTENQVLNTISTHGGIGKKNLSTLTGISIRTLSRIISSLIEKEKIERRGSNKTGGYWLVENNA